MLLSRERMQKRKIKGGNLIGNVWDTAKGTLSPSSKIVSRTLPILRTLLPEKPVQQETKELLQRIKEEVRDISSNPTVRKVLNDKSKAILSNILGKK